MKLDVSNFMNSMTLEQIDEEYGHYNKVESHSLLQQMKFMKNLSHKLGTPLTNEQLFFVCCNGVTALCDAGPGSGKTTCSMYALLHSWYFLKIPVGHALVVMYTEGSANDYRERIKSMIDRLNASGKDFLRVPDYPTVRTMHSLARLWIVEYKYDLNYNSVTIENALLEDVNGEFSEILSDNFEELDLTLSNEAKRKIVTFYNYYKEVGLDLENMSDHEIKKNRYYPSKNLPLTDLISIYKKYDDRKLILHKMDFTDFILNFEKLLTERDDILQRLRRVYKTVFSDEYQDMSLAFIRIIRRLVSDTTHAKFMGDSDQTLFDFRGSDAQNMLEFKNHYTEGIVTTLSLNMRCPRKIVELSNEVINTNKLRYDKQLYGLDKPYKIVAEKYHNRKEVVSSLVSLMQKKTKEELQNSMILFRNSRSSAFLVSYLLLKTNIPFTILSGARPFGDLLSRALLTFLNFIVDDTSEDIVRNLHYFTPLSKEQVKDVFLEYKTLREYFDTLKPGTRLHSSIDLLYQTRTRARKYEPSTCMKPVIDNIKLFYINFINSKMLEAGEVLDDALFELVEEFFIDPDLTCQQVQSKVMEYAEKASSLTGGISLSTIHTAKGSERDNIYIIDLDRNFPSQKGLSEDLTELQAQLYLEEEVRVFYVGITRTKYLLHVYHNESPFLSFFDKIEESKSLATATDTDIKIGRAHV